MNLRLPENECSSIAVSIAPEDLRRGDFVAVLSEIIELPSFLWRETLSGCRDELVRLRRLPTENRAPLKVKAICLPFVFVKSPNSEYHTIDVRLTRLMAAATEKKLRAKTVWKAMKPLATRPSPTC